MSQNGRMDSDSENKWTFPKKDLSETETYSQKRILMRLFPNVTLLGNLLKCASSHFEQTIC